MKYAVAQDNDFKTWRAFNNRYWPAKYFIDSEGNVRHTHFGEGAYAESELVIQQLLAEAGIETGELSARKRKAVIQTCRHLRPISDMRARSLLSLLKGLHLMKQAHILLPASIPLHRFAVSGEWNFSQEFAEASEPDSQLNLHFFAKDVYLVLDSPKPGRIRIEILGETAKNLSEDLDQNNEITIDEAHLYHLASFELPLEGTLVITYLDAGIQSYAFTFGS